MTQDEIKGLFFYKDGNLFWREGAKYGRHKDGKAIGCKNDKGYVIWQRYLNKKRSRYPLQNLVWAYFNGEKPLDYIIDHVDGNRNNNKIENLRLATHQQNSFNSKARGGSSQYKGVSFNKRLKKYQAYIHKNEKRKHIGYFDKEKEAALAYNFTAKTVFGDYAKLNGVSL